MSHKVPSFRAGTTLSRPNAYRLPRIDSSHDGTDGNSIAPHGQMEVK